MAQEASEASVCSSSAAANWWDIQASTLANWNAVGRWQTQNRHHSASSCEEDISISNASFTTASNNHSGGGLSMDSSPGADLAAGEPAENQLWSQVLFSCRRAENDGDMHHHNHDDGENFLQVLSSKSLSSTEMYYPACDYLKKLENAWGFGNPASVNNLDKQLSSYDDHGDLMAHHQRLTNLSNLVSNWSIAPPNPQLDHQIAPPAACNISINNPPMDHYSASNLSDHIKPELTNSSPSYAGGNNGMVVRDRSSGYLPYLHEFKGESHHQQMGTLEDPFARPPANSTGIRYQIGLNNSVIGLHNKFCTAAGVAADIPWSSTRDISDLISFKPVDFRSSKLAVKGSSSSDTKKQGCETNSSTSSRGSGRSSSGTASEGKKKRSEDNPETILKKSKHEFSTSASSTKLQVPKVKLGDRITALQQIVSPFGKTDTASVLLEAINYIRFLHEQVQLLSDPYMKSSANKDHNSWGGLERKEKMEQKVDLRSKGLCLVPISCTPQVYRDSSGPDYWTPTYRGCLYR